MRQEKIPRIEEIYDIEDFKIFCKFNLGEYRVIDFQKLFAEWKLQKTDIEFPLTNKEVFETVKINKGTLVWNEIKVKLLDELKNEIEYPLELDPVVLYNKSSFDTNKLLENIGFIIQDERIKTGFTQEQLALKTGISRKSISRIENNKSDVGITAIQKIFENGFGKKFKILID